MSDGISDGSPFGHRTWDQLKSALEEAERFGQNRTIELGQALKRAEAAEAELRLAEEHRVRLEEQLSAAVARAGAVEKERDLAIAHDRQPYPTADAYERVCAARTKWQERAEAAERTLAEMKRESAEAEEDERRNASLEQVEHAALMRGSDEWMRHVLGADLWGRLWGQPLEALGRGVDELRRRTLAAESALAEMRTRVEALVKEWETEAEKRCDDVSWYPLDDEDDRQHVACLKLGASFEREHARRLRSLLAPASGAPASSISPLPSVCPHGKPLVRGACAACAASPPASMDHATACAICDGDCVPACVHHAAKVARDTTTKEGRDDGK